jgi:hypothetical protein
MSKRMVSLSSPRKGSYRGGGQLTLRGSSHLRDNPSPPIESFKGLFISASTGNFFNLRDFAFGSLMGWEDFRFPAEAGVA